MGDTIMFRGRQRFLVLVRRVGVSLEKLRPNRFIGMVTHYAITPAERRTIRVVREGTAAARARARALVEGTCASHTRVEWNGDEPHYVHTVKGVEYR